MRTLAAWAVVTVMLLAGCTGSDSDEPAEGAESAIAQGDEEPETPASLSIHDGGDLTNGVDASWEFDLNDTLRELSIEVSIGNVDPVPARADLGLEVTLWHNGTVVDSKSSTSTSVNGGSAGFSQVFQYSREAGKNETLADHAGSWMLEISSDPMPGRYAIGIDGSY